DIRVGQAGERNLEDVELLPLRQCEEQLEGPLEHGCRHLEARADVSLLHRGDIITMVCAWPRSPPSSSSWPARSLRRPFLLHHRRRALRAHFKAHSTCGHPQPPSWTTPQLVFRA